MAQKGIVKVEDAIDMQYQTEKWGRPAKLLLQKIAAANGVATVQVKLLDNKDIPCLDAMNVVRFGITGDGILIANQGTASGSSVLQLGNGAAIIKVKTNDGKSVVSVKSNGIPTAFLTIQGNE